MNTVLISKLPIANWVESAVNWLTTTLSGFFNVIQDGGTHLMNGITNGLTAMPSWMVIIGLTVFAILVCGKKWGFPLFTFLGLLLIANQNLWSDLMSTFTLVLGSSLVSIISGVPLGIWMAK